MATMSNAPALKSFTTMNGLTLNEFAYNDDTGSLYPYRFSENLKKALQEMAVKVPFTKIIDKSMGTSTCTTCNSKYAGRHDGKCTHKGYFFQVGDWNRTNYLTIEEARKHSSYYNKINEVYGACDGRVDWNLQSEFS